MSRRDINGYNKNVMKKTLSYLKYTKKEAILGPLFKMLEVCFELIIPLIVSSIIDYGIKNDSGPDMKYIVLMCLLMFAFAVFGFISAVVAQYFSAKSAVRLATNLRNDLFKKVQSLQYEELDKIGNSTLINRLTSDVNQVQVGVNMTLRLLLRSPIVVIGAMIVAFTISFKIGLIFLITIPFLFLIIIGLLIIAIPLYRNSQERLDSVVRSTRENLTGVRVIRAFNKQDDEKNDFNYKNQQFLKSQLFVGKISALTNPLSYALINIFVIIIIYVGGIEVYSGTISQGNIVAIYSLASQILIEMIKLANLIMTISRSIASANRIEKVLNRESELMKEDRKEADEEYVLEFAHVFMKYKGAAEPSLKDISFKVKANQTIGIIGGTGSGKTTLINLIGHFYDIEKGEIYYHGKNLNSYDICSLREDIAYVPQKAKLFKGTIKDNILWGNDKATDEDVIKAIKIAQGEDILLKKEKGIYEEVEQDGKNFSGGQKQRLCIARALIKPANILILDDASSALDYATDYRLRKALHEEIKVTTFIVSQRTSSIQNCDQILVLDRGELVGTGRHEDLLKTCQVYQEIYYSQYKKETDNNEKK